jgi:hypothetical protein
MRLIHCPGCAAEADFRDVPVSEHGPAERVRRVDGRALFAMRCDGCNRDVGEGAPATAWSAWPAARGEMVEWEHEFLRPAKEGDDGEEDESQET